jgi:hypothetical protein
MSGTPHGLTLTREDLHRWAGRALTDDEVRHIHRAVPHSSIPDVL